MSTTPLRLDKGDNPPPTRGVPITLPGDRTRHLRYSLATIRKMREEFGGDLESGIGEENIGKMLHFGMVWEDPELTVDQVEDLIDMEHLQGVMEVVVRAMGGQGKVMAEARPEPDALPPADPEKKI